MKRLLLLSALAILLTSCKREERGFRVDPPDAGRISTKRLSTLQPGGKAETAVFRNEYENNAYALSEGKRLFETMNCTGCHAHGGGDIGPPLMDDKWIYGGEPDQVFSTIVEGRPNGMPSFGGKLPDYQVWQIAAYVRSLSGQAPFDAEPNRDDDLQFKKSESSKQREGVLNSSRPKSAEMPQ